MAQANLDGAPNPDKKCLKCHSKNLKKKLEDGGSMSLKIEASEFENSVHSTMGCTGCHEKVARSKHPSKQSIASSRAYSLEQNLVCSKCHKDMAEKYSGSIHASLVAEGDPDAPLCSSCHSPHSIQPHATLEPVSGEPCSHCHQEINEVYAYSVHGLARSGGNVLRGESVEAPTCTGCHQAHDVLAPADTDYLVSTCTGCHEGVERAHRQWLPNPAMHLRSVGCAVCHAPDAQLRVDLQLFDKEQNAPVRQNHKNVSVQNMLAEIDSDGDGLEPIELWKLMLQSGKDESSGNIVLRGRLEVDNDLDKHRLAASSEAIRSCENCHQATAEAFQNVTLSISRPDGRKESYKASNKVLSSPISLDSIGGFYAPGATRIKLFDFLLALALATGVALPVGHIALGKFLSRKKK